MASDVDHVHCRDDERRRRSSDGALCKEAVRSALYVRLHRTLYSNFGRVGGPAEALAVVSTLGLAWWTRKRRPAAFPSLAAAAGALAAAHGVYWAVVQPANKEMTQWSLDAIPVDWTAWRDRWEYGHAVRAGLVTFALSAMSWSLMTGTDEGDPHRSSMEPLGENRVVSPPPRKGE